MKKAILKFFISKQYSVYFRAISASTHSPEIQSSRVVWKYRHAHISVWYLSSAFLRITNIGMDLMDLPQVKCSELTCSVQVYIPLQQLMKKNLDAIN